MAGHPGHPGQDEQDRQAPGAAEPGVATARRWGLTLFAMLAFAANSLLCRAALRDTAIDAASFTTLRLVSGALLLVAVAWLRRDGGRGLLGRGSWPSALALFVYAAAFSFSYESVTAATGALLLFGAVQVTMIGHGLLQGERLRPLQTLGFLLAMGGLVVLLLPGVAAPPWAGSLLMLGAGVAWGIYSLRGRGSTRPTLVTAANFVRAAVLCVPLLAAARWLAGGIELAPQGVLLAVVSGAVTSGLGYVVWYAVLPALASTEAAVVQLSVPVIAALGAAALLGEAVTPRLVLASVVTLGGIAMVVLLRGARERGR